MVFATQPSVTQPVTIRRSRWLLRSTTSRPVPVNALDRYFVSTVSVGSGRNSSTKSCPHDAGRTRSVARPNDGCLYLLRALIHRARRWEGLSVTYVSGTVNWVWTTRTPYSRAAASSREIAEIAGRYRLRSPPIDWKMP